MFCVHEEAGVFSLGEAGRDVERESREPMGKTIEDVCGEVDGKSKSEQSLPKPTALTQLLETSMSEENRMR